MTAVTLGSVRTYSFLPTAAAPVAQTLAVAPILRRPYLPGAFARDPGEVIAPLRVTVRRGNDPWTPVVNLDQGKEYRWQDQLNEAGAASLVLANDDPDLDQIVPGDRILYEVDGYAAFTLLPREMSTVTIAEGEESAQLTTINGPGSLALLEEALVYPSRGLNAWPIEDDRLFSWPSVDYDDRWWGPSEVMAMNQQPFPEWVGGLWEEAHFPDPTAAWIWAPGFVRWDEPPGWCYFRQQFTVGGNAATDAKIYATIDNGGDLYIDGQKLISGMGDFRQVYDADVRLSDGPHTIAVAAANPYQVEGNAAAIIVSIFEVKPDQSQGALITNTAQGDWLCLSYPPTPPGMTPGEVMIHCVREAQSRGQLFDLTFTFNEFVDSFGRPWPIVGDIATKVGTDLLTFFREMSETYIDFAMSPAGNVLYAWISGSRGEHRAVALHAPTDVTDPTTGNLGTLTHKRQFTATKRCLVRWAGGWSVIDAYAPGREVLLGLGALQATEEMTRVATAQLAEIQDIRDEIAADVIPIGKVDQPVTAFGVGDYITVPDHLGNPTDERVISIGGNLDDNARLSWSVELKDRLLDERERAEQAQKKMINGTLRGTSKVATPLGFTPVRQIPFPPRGGG